MKRKSLIYLIIFILSISSISSTAMDKKRVFSPVQLIEQGDNLLDAEQYSDAVSYYLDAMARAKTINDIKYQGRIFTRLGMVYVRLNNVERAIHYLKLGYEFGEKAKDQQGMGIAAAHLVGVYAFNNDITNAKISFAKQKKLPHETEGLKKYFELFNEALICQIDQDYHRAIQLHKNAIQVVEQYKLNKEYPISDYGLMVYIYLSLGDTEKAFSYCEKCKEYSELAGSKKFLYTYHEMLRDIYTKLGDKASSDLHAHKADSIFMGVITKKQIESVDNRVVVFEDKQNHQEIDLLTEKVNRQFTIIILAIVIILLLALLAISIVIYARKLNTAYKLLVSKNKEIRLHDQVSHVLRSGTGKQEETADTESDDDTKEDSQLTDRKEKLTDLQARELLDKIVAVMEDISVISDPNFSLNTLAHKVESNTSYVSWIINNYYQRNFKTFLNEYRIKEACRRLEDEENFGHLTIQAIFVDLGYSSYSNFVAAFKKINGMTPSQYQKLVRSNNKLTS